MNTLQIQLDNLRHKQKLLALLIFSLVTIMFWVIISLVTSQQESKVDPALTKLSAPLNPNINEEVLSIIEQKRSYTVEELGSFPIYRLLTDQEVRDGFNTARSTPPIASGSSSLSSQLLTALPTPTPVATDSATATNSGETAPSPSPAL